MKKLLAVSTMKKLLALSMFTVSLLVIGVSVVSASQGATVRTMGTEVVKPNISVFSDFRFSPGPTTIKSGDTVTWVEKTGDTHTITLATQNQLVKTFSDFIGGTCPACTAAINAALAGHFGTTPPTPVLDPDGNGKFDSPGDSLLLAPSGSVSAQINVPAGTTLYYFCAIHPWMQGTINVK